MIRRVLPRASLALPVVVAISALSSPARADDDKSACIAAHEHAQVSRREGHVKKAREDLRTCSRAVCPALVRNDCVAWIDQVDNLSPTIMIRADRNGADLANVRVSIDNEVVTSRLDGKPIEVDPGEHVFRFETEGETPVTSTIIVREGEKSRAIPVHFGTDAALATGPGAATAPKGERPVPVGAWVVGGIGVASLINFAIFAGLGKGDQSDLEKTCSPNCNQHDIDGVKHKYLIADVSLGVGIAGVVGGALWYALRPTKHEAPIPAAARVDVSPMAGGAVVGWHSTF